MGTYQRQFKLKIKKYDWLTLVHLILFVFTTAYKDSFEYKSCIDNLQQKNFFKFIVDMGNYGPNETVYENRGVILCELFTIKQHDGLYMQCYNIIRKIF